MTIRGDVIDELIVRPGSAADLAHRPAEWSGSGELAKLAANPDDLDEAALALLARGREDLADVQELLWATGRYALLIVFQAMDAAGKDSTIKHIMWGVNPQGVQVVSFKKPSAEELGHTFLWRIGRAAPPRGSITIFNRSHYEEVVALRVHPEWLERQQLPGRDRGPDFWADRYEDINTFERHLDRNGTRVIKFFLHVSAAEQKRRFIRRLDHPDKMWKFNAADVAERRHWNDYMAAYDDALTATSTAWAPWYVLPADNKHVMQAFAADIIANTIRSLGLDWPSVTDADRDAAEQARRELEAEPEAAPHRDRVHSGEGQSS